MSDRVPLSEWLALLKRALSLHKNSPLREYALIELEIRRLENQ